MSEPGEQRPEAAGEAATRRTARSEVVDLRAALRDEEPVRVARIDELGDLGSGGDGTDPPVARLDQVARGVQSPERAPVARLDRAARRIPDSERAPVARLGPGRWAEGAPDEQDQVRPGGDTRSSRGRARRSPSASEARADPAPSGAGTGGKARGSSPNGPARRGRAVGSGQTEGRSAGRGRRARAGEPDTRTPDEQEAAAKEICLRLLTDRARTKHELAQALQRRGIDDGVAQRVLERFDEVGLIDDEAFAATWVRSRHRTRGLGRRALAQELRRKGVDKETADTALTEVDDEAEARRARELVDKRLRSMAATTPDERARAGRRLLGMLARKGYPPGIAYGVVREALAEHGADEDELGPTDLH